MDVRSLNPTFHINSSDYILKQWIPYGFPLNRSFPIRISTVASPSSFWIQMEGPQYTDRLEQLEEQMTTHYNQLINHEEKYFQNLSEIKRERYAAVFINHTVHRVMVHRIELNDNDDDVFALLYHCDHGIVSKIECEKLMRLDTPFIYFPQQAIWATLAHIVPSNNVLPWSDDACSRFIDLVRGKKLEAQLVGVSKPRLKMHLMVNDITNPFAEITLNDALMDAGFAKAGKTINID